MALEFLRQNAINDFCTSDSDIGQKKTAKKHSKKKISILLSGNLIIWLIFAVSFFDINVFSMPSLPLFSKPNKLIVTGIVSNHKLPLAIISNKVYREGEEISGYTITSITRKGVELQKGDKTIFRELQSNDKN